FTNGTIFRGTGIDGITLEVRSTSDDAAFTQMLSEPITIVNTPNQGISQFADADFIYFTNHPDFGSFRVFEGDSTTVQVIGEFDELRVTGFGAVGDANAGFVSPSIGALVPEPSTLCLLAAGGIGAGLVRLFRRKGSNAPGQNSR